MTLEINQKKTAAENRNTWSLNNMLLNKQWVVEEIKEEITKYFETNENKNTTFQNFGVTAKAVLRGKFIVIYAYLRKQEKSQINNLTLHQRNEKVSRRKVIIKNREEINEIEMKKKIGKINETKNLFFKKINKIDKPLARLIKIKRAPINKIRHEKGNVTIDTPEIQRIRDYYEQLYANKIDNLVEMDKLLEMYNLPRLNQEKIKRPIKSVEIETVI